MMRGYSVVFVRIDRKPDEIYFYRELEEAEFHLRMFEDDDSGLYSKIYIRFEK